MQNQHIFGHLARPRTLALLAAVAAVPAVGLGCEEGDASVDAREEMAEADARVEQAASDSADDLRDEGGDRLESAADAIDEAEGEVADRRARREQLLAEARRIDQELAEMNEEQINAMSETRLDEMLQKANELIEDGQVDQARSIVDRIAGNIDRLPAGVQENIRAAQALLDRADAIDPAK